MENFNLRLLVIGCSGSGKSFNLPKILKFYPIKFDKIFVFGNNANSQAETYNRLKILSKNLWLSDTLPDIEKLLNDKQNIEKYKSQNHILIFDDIDEKQMNLITPIFKRGRPIKLNVVLINQSYFKIPIDLRNNANSFVFFRQEGDLSSFYRDKKRYFKKNQEIFNSLVDSLDLKKNKYNYIMLNTFELEIPRVLRGYEEIDIPKQVDNLNLMKKIGEEKSFII